MPERVLGEDWSAYDNRKRRWTDRFFFSCGEPWEVDYLVRTILNVYPVISEIAIRQAIDFCCKRMERPRPRDKFVRFVMHHLQQEKQRTAISI